MRIGAKPLDGGDSLHYLQRLSEAAATLLEQGELDEWEQQRASLQQNLLPVLTSLETSVDPSDEHVVEDVRKRWCCFLEQDLGSGLEITISTLMRK